MTTVEVPARKLVEKANLHFARREFPKAEALYRFLLDVAPPAAVARTKFNLALSLLHQAKYEEGFLHYEVRAEVPEIDTQRPQLPISEWKGEPISSLLLWPEQGFGDCIMFGRYIPVLQARGIRVTVLTYPRLAPLLSAIAPTLATTGEIAIPRHDAWAFIGSLPHRLGSTAETIPAAAYLPGSAGGEGVGFAWRGNPKNQIDQNRSLPGPCLPGRDLDPEATGAKDFAETAAIIRELGLVISVDTAIVHLSAAMGKPTWALLPYYGPDWRWASGSTSPWYPNVRLFRQTKPSDWSSVLQDVESALGTL